MKFIREPIIDSLGKAPDYVCIPMGNAGNITAYWMGFNEYFPSYNMMFHLD